MSFLKPSPFELYLPEGSGPFPLICLTPILGRLAFLEDLFFERRLARFFASQGLAAALIDRPFFEFHRGRGLEQIQEYLEASCSRSQSILDSLLTRSEIESRQIGSLGISFGAVVNALWVASDPRLKAHIFVLGGGNLPEIFMSSRDPLMRNYLEAILKSRGTESFPPRAREELKAAFREAIRVDPLEVAHSIPKENVLMVLALFDRVIRLPYGLALWRALGKPKTFFLPVGHYSSILLLPFLKWKLLAFFKKKFTELKG